MTEKKRRSSRRTQTHEGESDLSGAVIPASEEIPVDVVHLIPAETVEDIDTEGVSVPLGARREVARVRLPLPGETVITVPAPDASPSEAELDRREQGKSRRRKRTGPPVDKTGRGGSEGVRTRRRARVTDAQTPPQDPAPVDSAPVDPAPVDPAPVQTEPSGPAPSVSEAPDAGGC